MKNVLKRDAGKSVNNGKDQRFSAFVLLMFGLFLISGFDITKFDMTHVMMY